MLSDETLRAYRDPAVVAHYDGLALRESEKHLFGRHLKRGLSLLDLGVGAGRTTPALAALAGRYVGLDFSDRMVARCREKFPRETFVVGDAADLSSWRDAEFDAVVFSFNGLGCLPTDEARARCLREVARVLRPGGSFVFSLHNPRHLVFVPVLEGAPLHKIPWRVVYAIVSTGRIVSRKLPNAAYRRGHGYVSDGTGTGGPAVFAASPEHVARELSAAGLRVVERVSADFPDERRPALTPWYYYAAVKSP